MGKFIGVKLVDAKPAESMIPMGQHEKGTQGYEVVYPDGYTSWCPKDVFENTNLLINGEDNKIHPEDVKAMISHTLTTTITSIGSESKTTVVICTLVNGFTITESSACIDPANYNEEIGAEICMNKIHDKIWFLLGFLLQSAVYGFNGEAQNGK